MGGFFGFLYRQRTFQSQPLPSSVRLDGQVAIITGSNVGLGFEAAKELIEHGLSRLIVAVRSETKGETAKSELQQLIPKSSCQIDVWPVDQENYDSIVAFAERVGTLDRIDIAILNAGVKYLKFEKSRAGHEMSVQVNHIGTALLSLLLVPHLQASAQKYGKPSRLTMTGSEVHFWAKFPQRNANNILEALDKPDQFGADMERYNTSKLLTHLWANELASHVDAHQVIIDTMNPGLCATPLHRQDATAGFKIFLKLFAWTPAQGAHCITHAAVMGDQSYHGEYFSEQKKAQYVFPAFNRFQSRC